jgi:ribosomal protein S19
MDASEVDKENKVRKDLRDSIIWTVVGLLVLIFLGYAFKIALVSHSI